MDQEGSELNLGGWEGFKQEKAEEKALQAEELAKVRGWKLCLAVSSEETSDKSRRYYTLAVQQIMRN